MALLQCNFFSQALMRTVPIQVVLPTDKTLGPSRGFCLAYHTSGKDCNPSAWGVAPRAIRGGCTPGNSRPWQLASLVLIKRIAHVRGGGCC